MQVRELKDILSREYNFASWIRAIDFVFPKVQYEASEVDLVDTSGMTEYIHQKGEIYLTDHKKVVILEVCIKANHKIARSKVGFHHLSIKYIDQANNHGLLVFYKSADENQKDYRLSLICKESRFTETGELAEFKTNPKRYTYLLGPNEASATAAKRLRELAAKKNTFDFELNDVIEAFSVEKLNDDFFKKYKEQYQIFTNYLANPANGYRYEIFKINRSETEAQKEANELPIRNFVKKLLARLVFLYFLQRKGWMGVATPTDGEKIEWSNGFKDFVSRLFNEVTDKGKFHSKYLSALFYHTLNKADRKDFVFLIDRNSPFAANNKVSVPYLNGGLFDNDFKEGNKIDFPVNLFESLFDFLGQYNFTIDENSPEDHEVGIDPEMLGHIFENLLEDNRDKGAYYTPKEVVHYMSQKSLIEYLKHRLEIEDESIDNFIKKGELSNVITNKAKTIKQLLEEVKVCDPAIGSGAFPMGVLKEIFAALQRLHTVLSPDVPFNEADAKKGIIQHSIYGVDLESGAVDIARLRFWLALVVDEDEPQPLPNLDYKIITGNSLIHKHPIDAAIDNVFKDFNDKVKRNDYNHPKVKEMVGNNVVDLAFYKKAVEDFLNESSIDKKEIFKELISEIKGAFRTYFDSGKRNELIRKKAKLHTYESANLFGHNRNTKEKKRISDLKAEIKTLEKKKVDIESGKLFEKAVEWRFEFPGLLDDNGDFTGFDIVIGNPPYIKEHTNRSAFTGLRSNPYFIGKMDIWHFFASYFIDLLKEDGGIQCFIAQNNWVTSAGSVKMRKKVLKDTEMLSFVDFGNYKVFQNAGIQTMIYVLKKTPNPRESYTTQYSRLLVDNIDKSFLDHFLQTDRATEQDSFEKIDFEFIPNNYENGYITFANDSTGSILNLIQNKESQFLLSNEVASGIDFTQDYLNKKSVAKLGGDFKVGDGVFALSKSELENLSLSNDEQELIKPYYSTSEFGRYYGDSDNQNWLIYTDSSFKKVERIEPYPNIKKHLDQFQDIITSANKPYGLHRARDEQYFKGEKILSLRKCTNRPVFTYVNFDSYVSRPFLIIKTERFNLKYLTALLNSKLIAFWLRHKGKMQGNNYQIDKEPLASIPIIQTSYEQIFATLVDYILLLHQPQKEEFIKYIGNDLIIHSIEEVIDQAIYELYFGYEPEMQELKVLEHLQELQPLSGNNTDEDVETVVKFYHWLHEQKNPIRNILLKANIVSKDIVGEINATIS